MNIAASGHKNRKLNIFFRKRVVVLFSDANFDARQSSCVLFNFEHT